MKIIETYKGCNIYLVKVLSRDDELEVALETNVNEKKFSLCCPLNAYLGLDEKNLDAKELVINGLKQNINEELGNRL